MPERLPWRLRLMGEARRFGLDAWRALAILLVLAGHASFFFLPLTKDLDAWYGLAFLGVELFFVLSGFLIGGILIGEFRSGSFRLRRFWTRRWLRTLPNYFLFLALNIVLYRITYGVWPQFGLFLVFLQNFAWPHPPWFSEAWSLSVEELFYLIAPVVVLMVGRVSKRRGGTVAWLLLAIAVVTAIRVGYVLRYDPLWDSGVRKIALLRLDTFIYGVLAAWLCTAHAISPRARRWLALAGACGTAAVALVFFLSARDHDFFARTFLFNLIPASLAAMLPLAAEWRAEGVPQLVQAATHRIALWSYSLYLCQLAVMRGMSLLPWQASTPLQCLLGAAVFVAASIACAAFVYHFFELPILRWRDRVTGRSRAAGVAPAA
ncbi:acyltransferase [Rudaea sp.]|uniref:acyltransferase family protein n=1 Tax=Rudaea sp. TaxID=2136325 RepID=UPI0032202711